jgi:hypothetical protein
MGFSSKKKDRRWGWKKIIPVLLLVFGMGIFASNFLIQEILVFDMYEVKMDIKVIEENIVGLNVDTDAIHFGKMQRGSEGIRNITLANNDANPHLIKIKAFGNISNFISVSENNFIINPNTSKNLSVIAKPPLDSLAGYYEGTLQVLFLNIY